MFVPIKAAHYNPKYFSTINKLVLTNLESADQIWGDAFERSFQHVLVGDIHQCTKKWIEWQNKKDFICMDEESFFIYLHSIDNKKIDQISILGALDLHKATIYTHEKTYKERVLNAQKRSLALQTDLSPIMVGLADNQRAMFVKLLNDCQKNNPFIEFESETFGKQKIWQLLKHIDEIKNFFKNQELYLLDGHHRLEAAQLNIIDGKGDAKIFTCLTTMNSADLHILPFHRSIKYDSWISIEKILNSLKRHNLTIFQLEKFKTDTIDKLILELKSNECLLLAAQDKFLYKIEFDATEQSSNLPILAVKELENRVFKSEPSFIANPMKDIQACLEQMLSGYAEATFFLPPLTANEIASVAKSAESLPEKSTRFWPKPTLGLLVRPWL